MVVFAGNGIPELTTLTSQTLRDSDKRTMADSVYITFRIAQLISSFRRRIKTRVLSNATNKVSTARLQDGLSEEFEKEVLEVVSKCRRQRRPTHRKRRNIRSEARKQPQVIGQAIGDSGIGRCLASVEDPEPQKANSCSAEWILAQLDSRLSSKGCSVLELATDDRLLLNRWYEIDFRGGIHKAAELLALVERLLLDNAFATCLSGDMTICEGREVMADSTFAPNLEHILLCLQGDLLRFLLIEPAFMKILAHIMECQREQSRRCETWFFEFPDSRHPLSTTWPWSIRPSLAVLWGVCWMFMAHEKDEFDDLYFDSAGDMWSKSGTLIATREQMATINFEPTIFVSPPQPQPQPQAHATDRSYSEYATPTHQPQHGTSGPAATLTGRHLVLPTNPLISNAGSTQPRGSYVEPDASASNSYRSGIETSAVRGQLGLATTSTWFSDHHYNSRLGPQRQQGASISHFPLPAITTDLYPAHQPSPSTTPYDPSMTKTSTIPEPVMVREPSPDPSEKDSVITDSQPGSSVKYEELDDTTDSPSSLQHRRTKTRREPKTFAEDGKFICTTCQQAFERKCEWNKHMDKHERPYKCERTQCAKLLGFTYSGGLLRHEREVHNMHGGPKAQLYCPVNDCKRHSTQGFTRKENLLEHLRRVHPSVQIEEVASATTPVRRTSEATSDWNAINSESTKRKRCSLTYEESQSQSQLPDDSVGREIKKLRSENGELRRNYEDQQKELIGWKEEITKMKQQIERMLKLQQGAPGSG